MERSLSMDLMRLLHGELPPDEARALELRLAREPELAASYRQLRARWDGLDLPPARSLPPGFTGRVMAHVRGEARGEEGALLSWSSAPRWVRACAAAALVAGLGLGAGLGLLPARAASATSATGSSTSILTSAWSDQLPLNDSDWLGIEEEGHS